MPRCRALVRGSLQCQARWLSVTVCSLVSLPGTSPQWCKVCTVNLKLILACICEALTGIRTMLLGVPDKTLCLADKLRSTHEHCTLICRVMGWLYRFGLAYRFWKTYFRVWTESIFKCITRSFLWYHSLKKMCSSLENKLYILHISSNPCNSLSSLFLNVKTNQNKTNTFLFHYP